MKYKDIWEKINNLSKEELNRKLKLIGINPEEEEFYTEDGKLDKMKVVEDIMKDFVFITPKDTQEIFYYNDGIYHPNGEVLIKEEVQKRIPSITKRMKEEIIETIKGKTYIDREKINEHKNLIHLKNGIFDLETKKIRMFSPEIISTTQIPVKYQEGAECPKILKFLKEVVGEEQIKLTQELFGYILLRDYIFNKAFMLIGSGRNGKTTFLNLITKFLGEDNTVSISLQDLLYNRFAKAKLYGKMANIYDDLPNSRLTATGNFKILTGKGRIWADLKFRSGFEFYNHAKLIFSCNELPRTDDTTEAFFRRWELLKFENYFEGDKEKPNILEEIVTEEELSGLFNWAIKGLERIFKQNGFTKTRETDFVKTEWITLTDPLRAFVEKFVEYDINSYVKKSDFTQAVNEFCEEHDSPKLTSQFIGLKLPSILPKIRSERITIDGKQERIWSGILVKNERCKSGKHEKNKTDIQSYFTLNNNNNNNNNIYIDRNNFGLLSKKVLNIYPKNGVKSGFELEIQANKEFGIEADDFWKIHEKLKYNGVIFEPKSGFFKKT